MLIIIFTLSTNVCHLHNSIGVYVLLSKVNRIWTISQYPVSLAYGHLSLYVSNVRLNYVFMIKVIMFKKLPLLAQRHGDEIAENP